MPRRRSAKGSRPRVVALTAVGLVVVVVALGALMAWQGWSAYGSARDASASLSKFRAQLLDRDVDGAEQTLAQAQDETSDARSSLSGPQWSLAAALPVVGDDVDAARRLAVTADDVTQGALPAAMTALSLADPREIGFSNGGVTLAPIERASSQLSRAADLLRESDEDAQSIGTAGLTDAIRDRVVDTQDQLSDTSRLATNAAVAGELLPGMLGGDGPRNYLLVAQNNAEQRSLGGLAGSFAVIRADGGRLSLRQQAVPDDLGTFEPPVLPLTDAERALFGNVLGIFPANVTDTPDFPRAAQLIKAMWEDREESELDGVVAVDPYALQLILGVVGPAETDAGRLNGTNAVQRLLRDVYAEFPDPGEQNEVFAQAARAVFDRVSEFDGDPRELTRALAEGVDQGRVMVWSAVPEEQNVLAGTPLGRTLQDPTPGSPRVGVYLHDRVASKIGPYQQAGIRLTPERCGTTTSMEVEIVLSSRVPRDRDLPISVTGDGSRATPGDIVSQVLVYAPRGWTIDGIDSSDGRRDLVTYQHDGLWAGTRDFTLTPGQEKTLTVRMSGDALSSDWNVRFTPGATPANVRVDAPSCT